MKTARTLKLEALDTLGPKVIELGKFLDKLSLSVDDINMEGKLYYFASMAEHLSQVAKSYHTKIHMVNAYPALTEDCANKMEVLL